MRRFQNGSASPGIVEQPAVAEVAQLARRRLLGARLVEHEAPGEVGVEDPNAGHRRTIRGWRAPSRYRGAHTRRQEVAMRSSLRGIATLSTALVLARLRRAAPTTPTASCPAATATAATAAGSVRRFDRHDTVVARASPTTRGRAPQRQGRRRHHVDEQRHRAAPASQLDDDSCGMSANIAGGGTQSLVFSKAGTLPVPLRRAPEHEGHDHDLLGPGARQPPAAAGRCNQCGPAC